jgi:hypothetical protein
MIGLAAVGQGERVNPLIVPNRMGKVEDGADGVVERLLGSGRGALDAE